LAFDHCGVNAAAMIKHQSQRGELLPNGGQNGSKIKEIIFQRVLTKSAAS
jgi:hypothetical protein